MANEITKVTDQNGVDHPFKDVAAFTRSEQAVLGAKNLLPFNWLWTDAGNLAGTIALTKNDDGTIDVSAGSSTTGGGKWIYNGTMKALGLKKGRYTLNGEIKNISAGNIYFTVKDNTASADHNINKNLSSVDFEITDANIEHTWHIYVWVENNTTVDSAFTIKPMVRLASDPDDTFVPPAKTNRELTEKANVDYSTNEQNTGLKWIDGKPVYQKTISFTISDTVTQNIPHGISNFKYGWIKENFIPNSNDIMYSLLDSEWFKSLDISKTNIVLTKGDASHFEGVTAIVTLQYTKTTD